MFQEPNFMPRAQNEIIRLGLVDSQQILLESLCHRFNEFSDVQVAMTATAAETAVPLIGETAPDILLLDVDLPDQNGFEVLEAIRQESPLTRVILLTDFVSDIFIEQALRHDVKCYLTKSVPFDQLVECIRRVMEGHVYFCDEVNDRLEFNPHIGKPTVKSRNAIVSLTNRQLEVLRYLALGASVKEVATSMHISEKSVDSHKYRIMQKLGIHDRVHLARFAIREGLVMP